MMDLVFQRRIYRIFSSVFIEWIRGARGRQAAPGLA
jgi:hypothetical protein